MLSLRWEGGTLIWGGYAYFFYQVFQGLRLIEGLRLLETIEYIKLSYFIGLENFLILCMQRFLFNFMVDLCVRLIPGMYLMD